MRPMTEEEAQVCGACRAPDGYPIGWVDGDEWVWVMPLLGGRARIAWGSSGGPRSGW